MPREVSHCICLLVIFNDSVCKTSKNYYPQVFLKECKYIVEEKKIKKFVNDDI